MAKQERNTSFGVTLPMSMYRQLQMQYLESDCKTFQEWMRSFIEDGLSTLPTLEVNVKEVRKVTRRERVAGR